MYARICLSLKYSTTTTTGGGGRTARVVDGMSCAILPTAMAFIRSTSVAGAGACFFLPLILTTIERITAVKKNGDRKNTNCEEEYDDDDEGCFCYYHHFIVVVLITVVLMIFIFMSS